MRQLKWFGRVLPVLVTASLVLTTGAFAYDRQQSAAPGHPRWSSATHDVMTSHAPEVAALMRDWLNDVLIRQ